jgi:4-carboxymuconolactone decarboxylase
MSDSPDFGTFGRFVETPVAEMDADMKSAYEYTVKLRGQVPGPHKIWPANPKLSRTIVPTGAHYQTESTLTKAEIEIVTSVINGHWGAAYSNYEHEKIGEELGHLPTASVDALIAGLPTSFEDPRQRVVYELACAGRSAGGAGGPVPPGAGPARRSGHRRCDRPYGVVHRCIADADGLRRAVKRHRPETVASQQRS